MKTAAESRSRARLAIVASVIIGVALLYLAGRDLDFGKIGAYVEGPFDHDGTSFSLPLNTICYEISEDLMPGDLDYGRFRPCRNPVFWD